MIRRIGIALLALLCWSAPAWAVPSYGCAGTYSNTLTATGGSCVATGNLIIAIVGNYGNANTCPSGFSEPTNCATGPTADGNSMYGILCVRVATSGDTSSSSYTFGGTSNFPGSQVWYYSGTNGTVDKCNAANAASSSPSSIFAPTVTTTVANDALLTIGINSGSTWGTVPSTPTNRVNVTTGSNIADLWMGDQTFASPGTTPSTYEFISSVNGSILSFTLAIEPTASSGAIGRVFFPIP